MDIQELLMPRRGHFLRKSTNKPASFTKIIDNTGSLALRTLQSGMMAGITSPARPWFKLGLVDKQMGENRNVKEWLRQVRDIMLDTFANSNVYNSLHVMYGELGGFGTAAIMPEFDFEDTIRSHNFSVGSFKIGTSDRGKVDVIVREFPMTAKQLVGKFGDKVSSVVKKAYDDGNYNFVYNTKHIVLPNDRRDIHMKDSQNKAYSSIYYEEGDQEEQYLRISGYDSFPMMVPRWEIKGEEHYGSGPGDFSLGDIKQLQVQQKRKAQGIDKMVNPPLQAPSSAEKSVISAIPGGVSYYDELSNTSGPPIGPLYQVTPQIGDLRDDIADTQQRISRAFYEDLFLMLAQSDRRMITAREIEEKHEEKLLMLGPVLERLHDELLDPFIDRTFNIGMEKGAFPEPPKELEEQSIKVEYISLLAQAQKAVGTASIERAFGFAGNLAEIFPDAKHKLNAVEGVGAYADMLGIPPEIIRTDDEVAERVQQENQAAQAQQAAEMGTQAAQGAKTLSEAETEDGNMLDRMLSGGQ